MSHLSHDPQADAVALGGSMFFLNGGLECLHVKDRVSPLCQGCGTESLSYLGFSVNEGPQS